MIEFIKKYKEFILAVFLWFCVWGTYNTDIFRFFSPGFPRNILDLIHGARSFLPFIAFVYSAIVLFKNRYLFKNLFYSPVGLLIVYSLLQIISSIFSREPLMAVYWGVLFGGVLFLLLIFMGNKEIIKKIIIVNFIIAGVLSLILIFLFLIQPGMINNITYNFLICSQRPYEGMGGLAVEALTFGMVNTRPTGLGRYAGVTAIACLAFFFFAIKKFKINWFVLFLIFLSILFFSKGKTEMVAFIASIFFLIWAFKKINIFSTIGTIIIITISAIVIFFNVPCTNTPIFINKIVSMINALKPQVQPPVVQTPPPVVQTPPPVVEAPPPTLVVQASPPVVEAPPPVVQKVQLPRITSRTASVINLSGRTGGVWKDSWGLFLKNPLFGFGAQADRYFLNGQHAHNTIIHTLIQAGILGVLAMVLAFIQLLVYVIKLFKMKEVEVKEKQFLIAITAVLIFFIVRGLTESLAFFSADWLFVAPIIAYIQCLYNEKKNKVNNQILEFRGSKVNIINMPKVLEKIEDWIKNEKDKFHWIIVTGMHGISEANKRPEFKKMLGFADLWVPDGISLIWLAKLKGLEAKERISGADLMKEFFRKACLPAGRENFSNYFYGDTQETLNLLNKKLKEDFPRLKIAGMFSPPFKDLTEYEEQEIIEKINNAKPDVLWVGLGLPKQEKWIYKNRGNIKVPVVVGVGAAFKFLSGTVKRAPKWMGKLGLEWLWRLLMEPKTTWKRVFIAGPYFLWLVLLDLVSFKRYK